MITEASSFIRRFLRDMLRGLIALQNEKQILQNASTRIAAINVSIQAMQDEAQKALDRLNALEGTTFTLADIRKLYEDA